MLNWGKQTTSSVASPFALSNVSGSVPLDSVTRTGAQVFFTIYDQGNEEYASGVGRISAADTLTVISYLHFWNGTTYDDTSPSVTFTAGEKDVYLGPVSEGVIPTMAVSPLAGNANDGIAPFANWPLDVNSSQAQGANSATAVLGLWVGAFSIDAVLMEITAAAGAGEGIKVGAYNVDPTNGGPGLLVLDFGEIAADATGVISASFTEAFLPPGWYWIVFFVEGACTITTADSSLKQGVLISGNNGNPVTCLVDATYTYPTGALPSDLSANAFTTEDGFDEAPICWLQAA